jgi:NAD(P)H-dependent FMN reductase
MRYTQQYLAKNHSHAQINEIDLGKDPLPMWNESVWQNTPDWQEILHPLRETITKSDAYIIITPEYSGMVSPALKNFFLFWNKNQMGNKPALIIGVSATRGGSYPVSELRSSSYKNTGLCYIPEHVIVAKAEGILNTFDETESKDDSYIQARLHYGVDMLLEYSKALRHVRDSGVPDYENFAFGM